jgi:hypothetical protein
MSDKIIGTGAYGEAHGLRPGTKLKRWRVHMIFNAGGMGDFVNYSAATLWLAKNCPWLVARLFAPRYLAPLMRDIHAVNPAWEVIESERFMEYFKEGISMIGPDVFIQGRNVSPQFLTCVGAHPVDVGFAYYANSSPPPADGFLPILDYPRNRLKKQVAELGRGYVVIATGNVHEARAVHGRHVNPIIEHVAACGLVPVFLGKKDILGNGVQTTKFPEDINYSRGLDLRDQTTVKEAACIMQHAACTVGLDCGLLHLAALMKDSRIVFGYNITTRDHRAPRRNHGKTIDITIDESELKCIGCQSKIKQVQHWFDKCLYGDTKCVDLLFKDAAARWRTAIDEMIRCS